ncbi:MAG TPA: hypothetical protein VMU36_10325 [Spirochaetia bacterium]|nr:hypothetical protein [Spirochaetia bacterium]
MDWRVRMRRDELELRRMIRGLAEMRGSDPLVVAAREKALRCLARKVTRMRTLVEDCISGRNAYEQSVMEYRVRIEFPLYSHLGSLTRITPGYIDWFCA